LKVFHLDRLEVVNCSFTNCNGSYYNKCAISISYSDADFNGNIIANNSCDGIGFGYHFGGELMNNTIANNIYAFSLWQVNPKIKNCIIYGNQSGTLGSVYSSNPQYFNCDVEGYTQTTNGNFNMDPLLLVAVNTLFRYKRIGPMTESLVMPN
jgi:hypothetical protein